MDPFVTPGSQGDRIPIGIIAESAASLNVTQLKFSHVSATLSACRSNRSRQSAALLAREALPPKSIGCRIPSACVASGPEDVTSYCSACLISWAIFESTPTGSTNKIWLGFRYMRSGACSSFPLFTSTLLVCFVSGFVCDTT